MGKYKNSKCKTCKFRAVRTAVNNCDYIVITKRSRGCSVEDCDKYEKGTRKDDHSHWKSPTNH